MDKKIINLFNIAKTAASFAAYLVTLVLTQDASAATALT